MGRFIAALIGGFGAMTLGACASPSDNPSGEGGESPGGAAGQNGGTASNAGAHSGTGGSLRPAAGAPDDNVSEAGATEAAGAAVGGADNGGQGATAGQPFECTSGVAGVAGSALGGSAGIAGSITGAGGSSSGAGGSSSGAGGSSSGAGGSSSGAGGSSSGAGGSSSGAGGSSSGAGGSSSGAGGSAGTGAIAGSGGSAGSGGLTGCISGPPCRPSNPCHVGILCGLTCVDSQLNVQAGAECGVAQICDATGQCIAPSCLAVPANLPNCVPEHPCHIGHCSASSSPPNYCTDLAYILGNAPDGTQCGASDTSVCSAGECLVKNCTADGQPCALGCADANGKVLKDGTPCETGKVCSVGRCIAHLSIAPANQVFAYVPGVSFTGPLAIVTNARLNETSSDLSATISWSDGTTSLGAVSGSSGTFTVIGSHTFTGEGPRQVTVTVVSGPPPGETVLLTFTVDTVTQSFDVPGYPQGIASGPDGNIWVATSSLFRVTTAGVITSFPVPTPALGSSITFGADGNLWMVAAGEIVRVTLTGSVAEFLLPVSSHYVYRITSGPDGNLWFTQHDSNTGAYRAVGRMTPSGVLTEFDPFAAGSVPYGITAGVDGALWLTENGANKVARMKTDGTVTEFALQRPNSHPSEIVSGADGNLWITERGNNGTAFLARVTTSGVVTEFPDVFPRMWGITAGPDNRVWFAGGLGIGAISSAGVVEQFTLPGPARAPTWITTGADGNLWVTDVTNQQVVRFKP